MAREEGLVERLKEAAGRPMSADERAAQRRSHIIGEVMLEHPEMTREDAEKIVDEVLSE